MCPAGWPGVGVSARARRRQCHAPTRTCAPCAPLAPQGFSSDGGGSGGAPPGASLTKPSALALAAAEAAARGAAGSVAGVGGATPRGEPAGFNRALVGDGGAGYGWPTADDTGPWAAMSSLAPPAVRCGDQACARGVEWAGVRRGCAAGRWPGG